MSDESEEVEGRAEGSGSEEAGFDERLAQLETIVAELEGGDMGLESAIEHYTRGIALLKGCHSTLAAQRKRVEELTLEADATLRPFVEDPDFDGEDVDGPGASGGAAD